MAKPGTVFQLVEGGNNHFWIVISEEKDGLVLVVNATDAAKCPDSPCQIKIGEHPVITKPTAIIYQRARAFESSKIDREIASGTYLRGLNDCSAELLSKGNVP